jgi:hypothetical protein
MVLLAFAITVTFGVMAGLAWARSSRATFAFLIVSGLASIRAGFLLLKWATGSTAAGALGALLFGPMFFLASVFIGVFAGCAHIGYKY